MTECPACLSLRDGHVLERHFDRFNRQEYRLYLCPDCGVTFSEPRRAVGPDWYERAAPLRATERRAPPERDWRYRQFFSDGLPPGKLLDVGCGDGGFLSLARARGFSVCGFDFEARMVELARRRGLADVQSMEFDEYCRGRSAEEFDVITLFDVLEHAPEPARFFGEIKRLLKPRGMVAITLPNADRPLPWGREEHDYPPHHFTRWTPAAMRRFLERNGFKVVRQSFSHLRLAYLADHFFYFVLMRKPLQWARRILFPGASGQTLSQLYEESSLQDKHPGQPGERERGGSATAAGSSWGSTVKSWLADKKVRQAMADGFKAACLPLTCSAALVLMIYYRSTRADCGDFLYTLARLESRSERPPS